MVESGVVGTAFHVAGVLIEWRESALENTGMVFALSLGLEQKSYWPLTPLHEYAFVQFRTSHVEVRLVSLLCET